MDSNRGVQPESSNTGTGSMKTGTYRPGARSDDVGKNQETAVGGDNTRDAGY
jgi:hypothetical protein